MLCCAEPPRTSPTWVGVHIEVVGGHAVRPQRVQQRLLVLGQLRRSERTDQADHTLLLGDVLNKLGHCTHTHTAQHMVVRQIQWDRPSSDTHPHSHVCCWAEVC